MLPLYGQKIGVFMVYFDTEDGIRIGMTIAMALMAVGITSLFLGLISVSEGAFSLIFSLI